MIAALLANSGEVASSTSGVHSSCRFDRCKEIGRLFFRDRDGRWLSIKGAGEVGGVEYISWSI